MTKEEREAFLADVHVGVISVAEDGHGPLVVPRARVRLLGRK